MTIDDPYEVLTIDVMIETSRLDMDLLYPLPFTAVHLVRDGLPFCQAGGFNLARWQVARVSTLRMNICGRCLYRAAAAERNGNHQ